MQQGTINNLKYSTHYPNILASCDEKGYISIIDTNAPIIKTSSTNNSQNNNTNISKLIDPIYYEQCHDNSIFGINWSDSDNRLLTASADQKGKIINFTSNSYGTTQLELIGHSKRLKCISQNVFNDNIICTSGGDSIIFIWDIRNPNKRYCNKYCPYYKTNSSIDHIHPVGAFRNVYKDYLFKKKYLPSEGGILNLEMPNTFTGSDFFSDDLVVSIETNNDEIKFWDMRNMLNTELDYIFTETKITKRHLCKFEQKNYLAAISPYTYLYTNYAMVKERHKMSSKYLSSNNMLFGGLNLIMSNAAMNKGKESNHTIDKYINKIKYFNNFDYEKTKNVEKEMLINSSSQANQNVNENESKDYEEEMYYKTKINELKTKRSKKGITSLNINRKERKILINSISNTQYVYDSLYMDIKKPIELKGHESSYYVKSVLSPCGRYVLSGSNKACVHIWDLHNKENVIELKGYHTTSVNAVDWNRNDNNFIASGCDSGCIILWSVNNN